MASSNRAGEIQNLFPQLASNSFALTSPTTGDYNCIAFAAGDDTRWWWPDSQDQDYWPPEAPRKVNVEAFIAAFEILGYEECKNDRFEKDFEKVAIFAKGVDPTHAARMLKNGQWTSKLGELEDISHVLHDVSGINYDEVACVMRRPWEPVKYAKKLRSRKYYLFGGGFLFLTIALLVLFSLLAKVFS